MIALRTIAMSAVLALCTTGLEPAQILTGEAQASNRKAPGTSKGTKKRAPRKKSRAAASSKVPSSSKQANAGKKRSRKSRKRSAKTGTASATTTPVAATAPGQPTSKAGTTHRASMVAVNGAPITQPRTTPMAAPGARASLDVNKAPRSPRSRTVSNGGPAGQRAANKGKKSDRLAKGYVAKKAVRTPRLGGAGKVTFADTPQTLVFDNELPVNRLRGKPTSQAGSDVQSTASSVLTRQQMPSHSQGSSHKVTGKIANAKSFGK